MTGRGQTVKHGPDVDLRPSVVVGLDDLDRLSGERQHSAQEDGRPHLVTGGKINHRMWNCPTSVAKRTSTNSEALE